MGVGLEGPVLGAGKVVFHNIILQDEVRLQSDLTPRPRPIYSLLLRTLAPKPYFCQRPQVGRVRTL